MKKEDQDMRGIGQLKVSFHDLNDFIKKLNQITQEIIMSHLCEKSSVQHVTVLD